MESCSLLNKADRKSGPRKWRHRDSHCRYENYTALKRSNRLKKKPLVKSNKQHKHGYYD